jgi:hypothetical protein
MKKTGGPKSCDTVPLTIAIVLEAASSKYFVATVFLLELNTCHKTEAVSVSYTRKCFHCGIPPFYLTIFTTYPQCIPDNLSNVGSPLYNRLFIHSGIPLFYKIIYNLPTLYTR